MSNDKPAHADDQNYSGLLAKLERALPQLRPRPWLERICLGITIILLIAAFVLLFLRAYEFVHALNGSLRLWVIFGMVVAISLTHMLVLMSFKAMFVKSIFVPFWLWRLSKEEFDGLRETIPRPIRTAIASRRLRRTADWWPSYLRAVLDENHAFEVLDDPPRSDKLRELHRMTTSKRGENIPFFIIFISFLLAIDFAPSALNYSVAQFACALCGIVIGVLLLIVRDAKSKQMVDSVLHGASSEFRRAAVSIPDLRHAFLAALLRMRKAEVIDTAELIALGEALEKANAQASK